MGLGVSQAQSGSPRPAIDQPAAYLQVFPERFHVSDQRLGCVGGKVGKGVCRERPAPSAPPLVETDDEELRRVEVLPVTVAHPGPRSPMDVECRLPGRIPRYLPVDPVPIPDSQHPGIKRFVRGEHPTSLRPRRTGPE